MMNGRVIKDQVSGSIVNEVNKTRILDEINKINIQDEALENALKETEKVREFIGSPENILGSEKTKHGEIAEQVEVGVGRARDILNQEEPTATFEGVGRTAPEDYLKDGVKVQSKYINGYNNSLKSVLDHMEKYEEFGRDGSYYEIPKDTHEVIEKIMRGEEVEGLKGSTRRAILRKVEEIETQNGKEFSEVVRPGVSTYDEVQLKKVNETLDNHEKGLKKENESKKEVIRENHKPSFNEGLKVAGMAAAVGAGISLTSSLYKKHKEGKKFYRGELTVEDWKEIGITTTKDGGMAGITGGAIYGLTNYVGMSAPFAAAVVSATKGVASLVKDYSQGNIDESELMELGMIVCSESAIVGVTTAIGQSIIPVPILGAVVGSIAGSMLVNILNFNKKTGEMIENQIRIALEKLEEKYQNMVIEIRESFESLGNLIEAAFNVENNLKLLEGSIGVAKALGVKNDKIMKSTKDVDRFILD